MANLIAFIKLTETFFFKFPPPTEKINKVSFLFKLEILRYSEKIELKPSSLVLAVISETLSVGLYASTLHNFLKSFTACEELPALPPTPKINNLPLFFLVKLIILAAFSSFLNLYFLKL